jgi:hypothetical protein
MLWRWQPREPRLDQYGLVGPAATSTGDPSWIGSWCLEASVLKGSQLLPFAVAGAVAAPGWREPEGQCSCQR